jgi:hypothetical protein
MRNMSGTLLRTTAVVACLCVTAATWAADDKTPSGTVSISSKSVAVGVGVKWGGGTLSFNGRSHHFSVDGLSVLDLGVSRIHAKGEVFNLNDVKDFSGHYIAGAEGIAVSSGSNDVIMRNDKGVVLRLHGAEKGVRLQLGGEGVDIKLKN